MPLALAANSAFRLADWVVLAAYLALLVATGVWLSRREQKTTSEYFLAGRRMPMWAVAVSIIATSLSAATFVGAPEQSYTGDLTYLSTNIGGLIAVVIVAYFFIPAFYRNNCATVYELLERRFGTSSKHATSAAFMAGRVFASGARIYIAAIPLSMILFGREGGQEANYLIASIIVLSVVGTIYALFGGIAGVIWTDVIQTVVLVVAVLSAIVVLWNKIDLPVPDILAELSFDKKLRMLDPGLSLSKSGVGFDPAAKFTLLTAVFGFSLLNIAAYGTDHDMVQRMLTCKSAVQGSRSVLVSLAIGIPIVACFLVVGLLLYIHYVVTIRRSMHGGHITMDYFGNTIFIDFILTEMPPGLAGLMLAGLFAAGVGSLTSAINAMAATFIKDFYTRWTPNRGERHYLAASKLAVVGWGALLAGFAIVCVYWQRASPGTTLISLALGVMTFAYAGLLAVFLTALFTKRGNTRSVIASLITGFVVIALLQDTVWKFWTPGVPGIGAYLSGVTIAFPWHMTIGTTLAFLVCVSGRADTRAAQAETVSTLRTCQQCGYNLAGVPALTCPECGHFQTADAPA